MQSCALYLYARCMASNQIKQNSKRGYSFSHNFCYKDIRDFKIYLKIDDITYSAQNNRFTWHTLLALILPALSGVNFGTVALKGPALTVSYKDFTVKILYLAVIRAGGIGAGVNLGPAE